MRLRNTARTLRNEVAQCSFDAARAGSLTQRVLRSQTILLDTNEHRCNTASLQSPVEKPLASRNTIRLSLIP